MAWPGRTMPGALSVRGPAVGMAVAVAAAVVLGCGTDAPSAPPSERGVGGHDGEVRAVARVVDGDTLVLVGGDRVRVLGIDSCEASTPAGAAATEATRSFLGDGFVRLRAENGVDRDPFGRLLRYVANHDGADLGEHLVAFAHTGLYQGPNDASPEYLSRLASRNAGLDCSAPS